LGGVLAITFLPWTPLQVAQGPCNGIAPVPSADLWFSLQTSVQGTVMARLTSACMETEWEHLSGYGGCSRMRWGRRSALQQHPDEQVSETPAFTCRFTRHRKLETHNTGQAWAHKG